MIEPGILVKLAHDQWNVKAGTICLITHIQMITGDVNNAPYYRITFLLPGGVIRSHIATWFGIEHTFDEIFVRGNEELF